MLDAILVIPARYKSGRLPGKPLIVIKGKTMLERVWTKCSKAFDKKKIFIATDDKRIQNLCKLKNYNCIMTSDKCLTGTDRVFEVSKKIKAKTYINVQGDEPLISPIDIKKVIQSSKKNKSYIINAMTKIDNEKDFRSVNVPKLTVDKNNFLMYMSRAPIPLNKENKFVEAYKQVCIYSFPSKQLSEFGKIKKKTYNENFEDIEILRFLENGYKVKMVKVSNSSIGVDTMKDVRRVSKLIIE